MVAMPWHWLLPREARPGAASTLVSRLAAAAVNAVDPVFGCEGRAAGEALGKKAAPVDAAIIGIIDAVDVQE